MKNLWFIRGVSGAGKSTVASLIASMSGTESIEADKFRYVDGEYKWSPNDNHRVHKECYNLAEAYAKEGHENIVVSNTSTRLRDVEKYMNLAKKYGYRTFSIIVENRHNTGNVHGVQEETLVQMEKQLLGSLKLK